MPAPRLVALVRFLSPVKQLKHVRGSDVVWSSAVTPSAWSLKVARPVKSAPVASVHAGSKAACHCLTPGPSKRTLVSCREPFRRPSPSHLSLMPKPPVHPTLPSMPILRAWEGSESGAWRRFAKAGTAQYRFCAEIQRARVAYRVFRTRRTTQTRSLPLSRGREGFRARVGNSASVSVRQLHRDRSPDRSEILPQTGVCAITINGTCTRLPAVMTYG